jgi:nucleoside-diphosphate-sugar epimerase
MKKVILIFGHGYVSKFLFQELIEEGWDVYCTSRDSDLNAKISYKNVKMTNFLSSDVSQILSSAHAILTTVPTEDQVIDPVLNTYFKEISEKKPKWIGYLSSTGVYGHHHGQWVNEKTECNPTNSKSKLRLLAENQWLSLFSNHYLPVHIFRLSGIYGPGRNCLEEIIRGKSSTVVKNDHHFSRIHVADICATIIASINSPNPGEIYNVSDDEPAPLHCVQQFGADILNRGKLKEVPFENAQLSQMAIDFFNDNKKVCNKKIKNELHVNLKYPNYRIGLLEGCLPHMGRF